jgi:hypothetical protein
MMSSFYGALRKEREVHVTDLFSDDTKSLAGPLAAAEPGLFLCAEKDGPSQMDLYRSFSGIA